MTVMCLASLYFIPRTIFPYSHYKSCSSAFYLEKDGSWSRRRPLLYRKSYDLFFAIRISGRDVDGFDSLRFLANHTVLCPELQTATNLQSLLALTQEDGLPDTSDMMCYQYRKIVPLKVLSIEWMPCCPVLFP